MLLFLAFSSAGFLRFMFLNFSTNKIMIKEQLAEIYLQSLGVEEMIKFVCSLTDEEIENFVL